MHVLTQRALQFYGFLFRKCSDHTYGPEMLDPLKRLQYLIVQSANHHMYSWRALNLSLVSGECVCGVCLPLPGMVPSYRVVTVVLGYLNKTFKNKGMGALDSEDYMD